MQIHFEDSDDRHLQYLRRFQTESRKESRSADGPVLGPQPPKQTLNQSRSEAYKSYHIFCSPDCSSDKDFAKSVKIVRSQCCSCNVSNKVTVMSRQTGSWYSLDSGWIDSGAMRPSRHASTGVQVFLTT